MQNTNREMLDLVVTEIIEAAEKAGVAVAGDRRHQGGLQAESVAISVLKDMAGKEMPQFKDADHRRAYFYLAVKNKYIDRLRKRRETQTEDGWAETQIGSREHAPVSRLMLLEGVGRDVDGLQRLTERLGSCCGSDADRHMVSRFIMSNEGWQQIAAQIEKTAGAAKVSFHRLRPALLQAVITPIQRALRAEDWVVCERVIGQRQAPDRVEEELGLRLGTVRDVIVSRVMPELLREYGTVGYEAIVRLLGKPRTSSEES